MPYQIIKKNNGKYIVMNTQTHHIFSKNSSKAKAIKQERLLYGLEHDMVLKSIPKKKKKY